MNNYQNQGTTLKLYYGSDFFTELLNNKQAWDEIVSYLERNKIERSNELLYIPDFDTSDEILNALKKISPLHKRKLLSDKPEYVQLRKELFPSGKSLMEIKEV